MRKHFQRIICYPIRCCILIAAVNIHIAVAGLRPLEDDVRPVLPVEHKESFVELLARFAANVLHHLHASLAQLPNARTVYLIVIVDGTDDYLGDAIADNGVGTRGRFPEMRARFKIDI